MSAKLFLIIQSKYFTTNFQGIGQYVRLLALINKTAIKFDIGIDNFQGRLRCGYNF